MDTRTQTTKRCRICNTEKPFSAFWKRAKGSQFTRTECKDCGKQRWSKWYRQPENRYAKIDEARAWAIAHPEQRRKHWEKFNASNKKP
jgi:hypothetical protein